MPLSCGKRGGLGGVTVEQSRIRRAVTDILEAVGEDPGREGLAETPLRVAQMYQSLFAGVGVGAEEAIDAVFEAKAADPVGVEGLVFHSICEHHLLPFFGEARIGYVPGASIAGVSKLGRALEIAAARPQVQERLTAEVAEAIYKVLQPEIVIVELEAEHLCMSMRGIRKPGSRMRTAAVRPEPSGYADDRVRDNRLRENREKLLNLMHKS